MCRSVPQMPAARTARSTCAGPGSGWGSSHNATFPSPRAVFTTACMVAMPAPPSSDRVQGWILLHLEGNGVVFQEAEQGVTLLGQREGSALHQRSKGCDGECGRLFLVLHSPGPGDSAILEERGRDATVLGP